MATILRVNMRDQNVGVEESPNVYRELGGRALTSALVADEVPATCHPLSAENKLVIAPGIFTGTGVPCAGRLSVGGKSPLTGTIKESNAGGMAGLALSALAIQAIVVEGEPPQGRLYRLLINKEGARLQPADDLAGLGNYDTVARQLDQFGAGVACISIGQAGEMLASAASIAVTDTEGRPTRHCGRGGMGAVMGTKGLKVIVIDPAGGQRVSPTDRESFQVAVRKFAAALQQHPLTSQTLPTYGTNILTNVINEAGALPTRNFSQGRFEGSEQISGEQQHDTIVERNGVIAHGCHRGCTIRCSRIYVNQSGEYVTKGPEYETVWAHGAQCGISDLDAIAQMDRLDDDYGLDTIETGVTIGVAMEAGILPFGDAPGAILLLEEVGKRTPLGRLVASGAETLGKVYGVKRIPTVKGQSMPAYDPRAVQGIGVTYATSTMGADHTAGYAVTANILGVGGRVDPLKPEGQIELSRNLQVATATIDAAGLCLFVAFPVLDDPAVMDTLCELFAAFYGRPFAAADFTAMGKQVLARERAFNRAAGFAPAQDRLPDFFRTERLAPHNVTFTVPDEELDKVLDFT